MSAWVWLTLAAAFLCRRRAAAAPVRLGRLSHGWAPAGGPAALRPGRRSRWREQLASARAPALARWHGPAGRALGGVLVSGGAGVGFVLRAPAVGLASGLILAAVFGAGVAALGTRAATRDRLDLLAAVSLLEAELAAGGQEYAALNAAASVAGRYRHALERAGRSAGSGGDVAAALTDSGESELAALASAWRVRARCGAALGQVLADVRRDLELSRARHREVAAALAGPRSSAMLLAGLPVLAMALGAGLGADPVGFLTAGGTGSIVLLVGVAADVAGLAWTGWLVRRALS